jgi:ketosteroid isomerase-like protein
MTVSRFIGVAVALAGGWLASSASAQSPVVDSSRSSCARPDERRSPEETIRAHIASLAAGDMDTAVCDYAEDATVILPGNVVAGRGAIASALAGFTALLGGAAPQITTLTTSGPVVLLTFHDDGAPCQIPDGADTYVVVRGAIVAQTVHDTLVSAPGSTCPSP